MGTFLQEAFEGQQLFYNLCLWAGLVIMNYSTHFANKNWPKQKIFEINPHIAEPDYIEEHFVLILGAM